MTITKTELLIAFLEARGADTEDAKDAAEREVQQALGALRAVTAATKNVEALIPQTKQLLQEAGCDLQQVEVGVRQVQRCAAVLLSMANTSRAQSNKLQGRAELLAEQVKGLAKDVASEREKLNAQQAAAAGGVDVQPARRAPGSRPGPTLKVVRQQEDKEAAKKKAPAKKRRAAAKRKSNGNGAKDTR